MNKLAPPSRATGKIGTVSLDRATAQAPMPSDSVGGGEIRTFIDTYFTRIPVDGQPTDIIYNGDRLWAQVTLTLETAGPVAIGHMSSIAPVLSGKGQLLETGVPTTFIIAKGTRLYVVATGINRIKRTIEPIPWLEMFAGLLQRLAGTRPATPRVG